jgi:hypothetical protein
MSKQKKTIEKPEEYFPKNHKELLKTDPNYPYTVKSRFVKMRIHAELAAYTKKYNLSENSARRHKKLMLLERKYGKQELKKKYVGIPLFGTQIKKSFTPPGWEWEDKQNTRPVRDDEHCLIGQSIWNRLVEYGFVNKTLFNDLWQAREGGRIKMVNKTETDFEKRLKNWLITGYWEKDRWV